MPLPRPMLRHISRSQKIGLPITVGSILALLVFAIFQSAYSTGQPIVKKINYTQLRHIGAASAATSLSIEGEVLTVTTQDDTVLQAVVTNQGAQQDIISLFAGNNIPIDFRSLQPSSLVTALSWIIPLLTFGVLGMIGWRIFSSISGQGNFRVRDSGGAQSVTFEDVAGIDEVKAELTETIEFLRDPLKFSRLGGRAPRGLLLSGSPGTGKTLLARAAANEAGVPFLSVAGSSFQEKFVGLGAARVRRLFTEARRLAPCIVFIDEIDAVGRQRGRGGDSASADQDQTLNQLLVEMDGFTRSNGVVVIASTNRPDVLDQALVRPGRFDREIAVNLPDLRGREQILAVHAQGLKLQPELDLGWIARGTPGFSGADLANLLNEAAIAATRREAETINRQHVEYARDKILMGAERHTLLMSEDERHATAIHEAGHVAVGLGVRYGDPVHKVSILPRGRLLGVAQFLPDRDRLMKRREYLEDQIAVLLGGRAAESALLGTVTAGASNDIERAVEIGRRMVTEFGMSQLGPIHLGKPEDPHSQKLLDRIEAAVNDIINTQMTRASEIIEARRTEIKRLVAELIDKDTLDKDEVHACFAATTEEQAAA